MSDDKVLVAYYMLRRMRRRKSINKKHKRQYWIRPFNLQSIQYSVNIVARELNVDREKFKGFYRMNQENYLSLLALVSQSITKKDTHYREAVSAEERLLITLRYLATGSSFAALSFQFFRGCSTISYILRETTAAIWKCLQPLYMPVPDAAKWKTVANRYYELWNIPNCLGAIDGKHIRIKKFRNTGSQNFNYKGYFSVVLMAVADADGMFVTVDVGDYGRNSDGAVFRTSKLGRLLNQNNLNIPSPQPLPHDGQDNAFPFYFCADEAFPLRKNIMRPYPQRVLDDTKRIFNYRLSRGRKSVECSFGMLVSKFRVFETPIACGEECVDNIIKAACVLHNFIRTKEGRLTRPGLVHDEDRLQENQITHFQIVSSEINENSSAITLRDYLADYFLNPEAAIPWQWAYCINT